MLKNIFKIVVLMGFIFVLTGCQCPCHSRHFSSGVVTPQFPPPPPYPGPHHFYSGVVSPQPPPPFSGRNHFSSGVVTPSPESGNSSGGFSSGVTR